jgi:hypothetical protein
MKCGASTRGFLLFKAHHHAEKCQRRENLFCFTRVSSLRQHRCWLTALPRNSQNLKATRRLSVPVTVQQRDVSPEDDSESKVLGLTPFPRFWQRLKKLEALLGNAAPLSAKVIRRN